MEKGETRYETAALENKEQKKVMGKDKGDSNELCIDMKSRGKVSVVHVKEENESLSLVQEDKLEKLQEQIDQAP